MVRKGSSVRVRQRALSNPAQVQKKIGPAWTERGHPPAGYFTKRTAEGGLRAVLDEARRGVLPVAHPGRSRHAVLVSSYSTSPCSAPGTGSSYGSPDANARANVNPRAAMVARDAALTAMV